MSITSSTLTKSEQSNQRRAKHRVLDLFTGSSEGLKLYRGDEFLVKTMRNYIQQFTICEDRFALEALAKYKEHIDINGIWDKRKGISVYEQEAVRAFDRQRQQIMRASDTLNVWESFKEESKSCFLRALQEHSFKHSTNWSIEPDLTKPISPANVPEQTARAKEDEQLSNKVRAIFGGKPFDEIMLLLQYFADNYQMSNAPMLPETPTDPATSIQAFARENGRKGKEKQLQNSVKEKFRLNKFQDLFKIWETRLRREEYGAKARFCETVKMYYDDYIDDLEKQGAKINEKDKVLTDDAIRRWLRKLM